MQKFGVVLFVVRPLRNSKFDPFRGHILVPQLHLARCTSGFGDVCKFPIWDVVGWAPSSRFQAVYFLHKNTGFFNNFAFQEAPQDSTILIFDRFLTVFATPPNVLLETPKNALRLTKYCDFWNCCFYTGFSILFWHLAFPGWTNWFAIVIIRVWALLWISCPQTQGIVTFGAPRLHFAEMARFHWVRSRFFAYV